MTTTKTTTRVQVPWLKYSDDVERQIKAGLAREAARGPRTTVTNGVTSYRDAGSDERYTVGYGGERQYQTRPARTVNGLSDKQKDLVDKLLVEKVHEYTEVQVTEAKADWRKGRSMIDTLIAAPRRPYQAPASVEVSTEPVRARLNFAEILDGNYAVRVDGVVKFYRVSTNEKGFKNVQARASDALHMMFGKSGIAVLHRIVEAGLAESRMLFATELGRCWRCGKSLTDEESRARGMGPDCASR